MTGKGKANQKLKKKAKRDGWVPSAEFGLEDPRVKLMTAVQPDREHQSHPVVAPARLSAGTLPAMAAELRKPLEKRSPSMLNQIVFKNASDEVPYNEIAKMVNLSVAEVRKIYFEELKANSTFTQAEMRLVLTSKMQRIINLMMDSAANGSVEHAKIIVNATERLAKIYELESQRSKVEFEFVTGHQTTLIIQLLAHAVARILDHPAIQAAVGPEVIDAIASDSMQEIEMKMLAVQGTMISPDDDKLAKS